MSGESYEFNAEINELLSLIISSFYSNADVFLRELISNASDALDKIRYVSLTDHDVLGEQTDLKIEIIPDVEAKTLTIRDTGIGMTKSDLVQNLGTIARSGTKNFMRAIDSGADSLSCIGQFGVGFYSAYLVAHEVKVITKHSDDDAHVWRSSAGGTFTIEDIEEDIPRGTSIILSMKDEHAGYLEEKKIKELIKTHSEFINFPIYLYVEKEREVEVEEAPKEDADAEDIPIEDADEPQVEDVDEDAEEAPAAEPKKRKEKYHEFDLVNTQEAIWTKKPEDVTEEEYKEFYKAVNPSDWEEPLSWVHFAKEGDFGFRALLYVPKRAPFDLFERQKKLKNIRLHVRRVFITDDAEMYCPEWLGFVRGVIDFEDLPLNISRETLQHNRVLGLVKKAIMKSLLKHFSKLAEDEEKYSTFYENFSQYLKLGINDDKKNMKKLAALLRFPTSRSGEEDISFETYVDRMKEGQKDIYYIAGESREAIENSSFMERLHKKGYEVIYMFNTLDEYAMNSLKDFNGHNLVNITKEKLEFDMDDDEKASFEELQTEYEPICTTIKEILGDKVTKVVVSNRLESSPCVLVASEYGFSANFAKIMAHQALQAQTGLGMMSSQKIMEINPTHSIIASLKTRLDEDKEDPATRNLVEVLYETTLLTSGWTIEQPLSFGDKIFKLLSFAFTGEEEAPVVADDEIPPLEEVEDDIDDSMEDVD